LKSRGGGRGRDHFKLPEGLGECAERFVEGVGSVGAQVGGGTQHLDDVHDHGVNVHHGHVVTGWLGVPIPGSVGIGWSFG